MAWKLCSKQDVEDLHNVAGEDLKDSWSELVEGLISEYMGSPALVSDIAYQEKHSGSNGYALNVRRPPIKSVTAVKFDGSTIASTDYIVGETTVTLLYYPFPSGHKNIEIDYTSGADTVPQSVRLAAASMLAACVNHYKRFGADGSLKWADTEQSVAGPTPTRDIGLITHLKAIMMSALRRNKLRII